MSKDNKSSLVTFLVFFVLQIIVFVIGLIFLIRGVVEMSSFFLLGIILIVVSGYMRFKYQIRKKNH